MSDLPHWRLKDNKLHREYKFVNFKDAFAFMSRVADVAEEMQHHPEWKNVYSLVVVDLFTHDAHGISERDFTLAGAMEKLANEIHDFS